MYEPDRVYEVTCRTIQGRMLLRPSKAANEAILGVLGRSLVLYPEIELYGFVFLSNHYTMLVSSKSPWLIPRFFNHLNGNLSRVLGIEHDWPGPMWGRRFRAIPIVDEEKLVERLRYLLAQGCKEHLVESPYDWPGATCVPALARGKKLVGTWFHRDLEYKARRRGKKTRKEDYSEQNPIQLSKIPGWQRLSEADYSARIRNLVQEIERDARKERDAKGISVLGPEIVLAQHPHARPKRLARSPAPICHASTRARRRQFKMTYRGYVQAFREAAALLRRGLSSQFPIYAFPPPQPVRVPDG
jgi:hypothetical protein